MSEAYTLTRDQLETVLRSTYAAGEQAGESPLSAAGDERRFRRAIDAAVARAAEYTARKPTNETTPDAVEAALCKMYRIIVCDYGTLSDMTVTATLALEGFLAERARHAEEMARLERERDLARACIPSKCPITGREHFMNIEHPDLGWVATYGGPYDSYTIPDVDEEGRLFCHRCDHDRGSWTDGTEDIGLMVVDDLRGSCEAEELRSGLEKLMADGDPRGADIVSRDSLQALLDKVDARDSLLTLETIDSLRDQLRKVEGEREEALRMVDGIRKSEKTARESMVINMRLRDEAQAENVQLKAELTSLRSLLPDVRLIAESAMHETTGGESCPEVLTREARAARRILAALDSQGGEGE